MATKLRGGGNSTVLQLNYGDPQVIKKLLRNWSGMEALSLKGDRNATCVLIDLQEATGIDLDYYSKDSRELFNSRWNNGVLSYCQYMAISYTLVLGYSQDEIAYMMGVDQSVIARTISRGVKSICRYLVSGGVDSE